MMPDTSGSKPADTEKQQTAAESVEEYYADTDTKSALANGLPDWNIEPPAVVVRRKVRAI